MVKVGSCFVVEFGFVSDGSFEISLFEDSNDADAYSASKAMDFMTNTFECTRPGAPKDYKDAYNAMLIEYNNGKHIHVVDAFSEFINKVIAVVDPDNVINIVVYCKDIKPATSNGSNSFNTPSGWVVVPTPPSVSTTKPVEVLTDVPCKVCKRNVNKSEKTCWHCGCDNPANS